VRCKWPNNLLVGGRKAGGIIAESSVIGGRFDHVVLGVGVNLATAPAGVPAAGAVGDVDPRALLEAFLAAFSDRYRPSHATFADVVRSAYRAECATLGRAVRAATIGGSVVEGEAVDIDGTGGLLVRTGGGLETVRFGEVTHLDA